MFELAMATPCRNEIPTIIFQYYQYISDFHSNHPRQAPNVHALNALRQQSLSGRHARCAGGVHIIDQCDIVHGHIFPYSAKTGTPAAQMPQVAAAVIKARAKALRDKVAERRDAWLSAQIGTTKTILVENSGRNGHAEDFALVALDTDQQPGAVIRAYITAAQYGSLQGTIRP